MKKGWEKTARLGDLFMTAAGGTPSTTKRKYYEGGTIPWLNSGEVRQGVVHSARTFITELGLRNSNAKIFPKDTVLVALYGATAAQVGILAIEAATNQAVFGIYPNSSFLPKFTFYFLLSCHQELSGQAVGSAQPNLSGLKVKDLQVPLASLPEQQRIVGILDEAFGGLATAQAHAAQNLQNARDLFESHLNAVFTQRGKGWVEKTLGDVAQLKNGLNYNRDSKGQTLPVVGVGDFQSNNLVPVDQLQTVTIDGELSKDYSLQYGDILTVRSNGSKDLVGRCMLVPELSETTSYSGFIIRIRVNDSEVFPPFLLHFMKSSDARDRLTRDGGGANISNINQAKLASLPLSLPPIAEQKKLVAQLDALSVETQRLTRI